MIAELGGAGAISNPAVSAVILGPQQGAILLKNPVVGLKRTIDQTPHQFMLAQNYPNPFNPTTTIRYALSRREHMSLTVHDLLGRPVAVLIDAQQSPGWHEVQWSGTNRLGQVASSGVYVMRLRAGDFTRSRKILMVR